MEYNLWIEVNRKKIIHNIENVANVVGDKVALMAIIKANAYGHGMLGIANVLNDKVDYFGVSSLAEARELRKYKILKPILLLGPLLKDEYSEAMKLELTFTVSAMHYLYELDYIAKKLNIKAKVHLKIDTGMGRWGFVYKDAYSQIRDIKKLQNIEAEGLFTHFPVADNIDFDYTERQIELFSLLIDELKKEGIEFKYLHAANSAGIVNFNDSHLNMVRPGIMLYGYLPNRAMQNKIDLKPAIMLKARISLIKIFSASRGVSYGRKYLTKNATRIAVVPIGYGEGYPYALAGKAEVLINGKRYPVAGSISMDYIMIDLNDDTSIQVGDEVVLLGESGKDEITAHELADKANTICYEILTGLNNNIPRVYM